MRVDEKCLHEHLYIDSNAVSHRSHCLSQGTYICDTGTARGVWGESSVFSRCPASSRFVDSQGAGGCR